MHSIFPWQQQQWQNIQQLILDERLPHALLFHGASDIGKYRMAEVVAETMLCSQQGTGSACGFCKQCQLLESGFHPDMMHLEPAGKGEQITVEMIRDVIEFSQKTSQQGGWKIAIINRADRMNTNAANALLKVLEEPPPTTLILLVTHDLSRLLPTIKSRCRQFRFPLPVSGEVIPWVAEVVSSEKTARELLQYAEGRPLLALRLEQEGSLETRKKMEAEWEMLAAGKGSALACAQACSKLEPIMVLDWLYYFVTGKIKSTASQADNRNLFRFVDSISKARVLTNSGHNPNLQLQWEVLMLDWQALAKARVG